MTIENLFFELLRVAIRTQDTLSRPPSEKEWALLYEMAKKQSLVGICFAGIQALETSQTSYLPEILYLRWVGMAAKIQQRNEVMNCHCAELQQIFTKDGFCCTIMKGQGIAKLYGSLAGFRQSGDIDVWLLPYGNWATKHNKKVKTTNEYLQTKGKLSHTTYHNSSIKLFGETDVEAHYTPSWMYSPIKNKRLQKWFSEIAPKEMVYEYSTIEFNMVYVLIHIYRHLFGEGIGLRQCLDYYFVLMHGQGARLECLTVLKRLKMMKFAGALMYIMQYCFGIKEDYLLCPADPEEGSFLLSEIMQAGNFGHYDERISRESKGLLGGFWLHVKRNMHFVAHYPSEVLWCPLWKVWHQMWLKRMNIYK